MKQARTEPVPVGAHGGHEGPLLADGVEALDRVEGLESVAPPHHVQTILHDGDAKLEAAPVHVGDLDPPVCAQVVLLYADRPCSSNSSDHTHLY